MRPLPGDARGLYRSPDDRWIRVTLRNIRREGDAMLADVLSDDTTLEIPLLANVPQCPSGDPPAGGCWILDPLLPHG